MCLSKGQSTKKPCLCGCELWKGREMSSWDFTFGGLEFAPVLSYHIWDQEECTLPSGCTHKDQCLDHHQNEKLLYHQPRSYLRLCYGARSQTSLETPNESIVFWNSLKLHYSTMMKSEHCCIRSFEQGSSMTACTRLGTTHIWYVRTTYHKLRFDFFNSARMKIFDVNSPWYSLQISQH